LSGNGYVAEEFISALTVSFITLIPQVALFMPLYAALVGGDLVAKEAEDGTLRMILSRPVSRFRLLFVKWLAGVIFSIALVLVLGGTELAFARMWFPWKSMLAFSPDDDLFSVMQAAEGLKLYAASHVLMAINASVVLGLGFMFSCFNMKPAAATILALSVYILSFVVEHIPFFQEYREWFLTYHFHAWLFLFAQPIPWARVLGSLSILIGFNLTAFLIGTAAFQARDIKS
jgi:ABC-2 type transport system permease protein